MALVFPVAFLILPQLNTSPAGKTNGTETVLSSLSLFRNMSLCISSLESLKILEKFYLPDSIISEGSNEIG